MQAATLKKTTPFIAFFPFILIIFKLYNIIYYIPFFVLSGYIFYQNYQNLPQEEKKGFLLTKLIGLSALAIMWAYFYFGR